MNIFFSVRIIFVLLFVCALAFGLRSREIFNEFSWNAKSALAQEQDAEFLAAIEPAQGEEEKKAEDGEESAEAEGKEMAGPAMPEGGAKVDDKSGGELGPAPMANNKEWKDASDTDIEYSGVQAELFEDLAQRRKDLQAREKELALREALIQAAEKELEQKYAELDNLKKNIEGLLVQQSAEESARISSLVKIYEGMKAKDAARIFDTLETDVLLSVLGQMSERKSAPILASMNPDRARSVTILLAEQKKLPDLSSQ